MSEILLNPGPVNVSERVRRALTRGDACHRETEVGDALGRTRAKLLKLFDPAAKFTAVFFTGSGTAALEAATLSAPGAGRKILVIDNGVYGDRIARIAAAHSISVERLRFAWEQRPDLSKVEAALSADPVIDTVAMIHHETTTGLLNPVKDVGAIAKKFGKRFVLDTVSGLGGEELDLDAWGVDLAASTANKCICGFPGISFVLVRKELLPQLAANPMRSLYLNVSHNYEAQKDSCGAFTPAIQILWALEEALDELAEEGVQNRIARFKEVSAYLRGEIARMGLPLYLDPAVLSNTITSFHLPKGKTYEWLHHFLKARGFVIYAGQGNLSSRIFRIANMGHVRKADYERFISVLKEAVA